MSLARHPVDFPFPFPFVFFCCIGWSCLGSGRDTKRPHVLKGFQMNVYRCLRCCSCYLCVGVGIVQARVKNLRVGCCRALIRRHWHLRRSGVFTHPLSCGGGRGGAMGVSLARHPTTPPAIAFGDVHLPSLPQAVTIFVASWTFETLLLSNRTSIRGTCCSE
ncbi:hypothetical protein H4582DRAFT_497399 [Lactarius indigo]|nr:hypothetical protein H4582DRAFT_497399 [Lactarius indigo]